MVLSTIAFYIRIYLQSLKFQEILGFSFYLLVIGVFELRQFVTSLGYSVFF